MSDNDLSLAVTNDNDLERQSTDDLALDTIVLPFENVSNDNNLERQSTDDLALDTIVLPFECGKSFTTYSELEKVVKAYENTHFAVLVKLKSEKWPEVVKEAALDHTGHELTEERFSHLPEQCSSRITAASDGQGPITYCPIQCIQLPYHQLKLSKKHRLNAKSIVQQLPETDELEQGDVLDPHVPSTSTVQDQHVPFTSAISPQIELTAVKLPKALKKNGNAKGFGQTVIGLDRGKKRKRPATVRSDIFENKSVIEKKRTILQILVEPEVAAGALAGFLITEEDVNVIPRIVPMQRLRDERIDIESVSILTLMLF
ncbi:hypothetical protein JTE90_019421 [Oedothorax gibbosus]|uniref:Uncharacterized protein n=1 Tax=Oedothorax gibbosus TaxID=931172 RepID=A0AAV6TV74_9ARAC|nr:hypothetical protein JTE90_019421 [Oedothorax gibbosus]